MRSVVYKSVNQSSLLFAKATLKVKSAGYPFVGKMKMLSEMIMMTVMAMVNELAHRQTSSSRVV